MEAQTNSAPIDLTRLNRAERRRIGKRLHVKIAGRNLPYVKAKHGSYENYYRIRAEEETKERKEHEDASGKQR